jgi:hypothetical protein
MFRSRFVVALLAPAASCCVEFRFGEVFAFGFVSNARIAGVRAGVDQLLASGADVPSDVIPKNVLRVR